MKRILTALAAFIVGGSMNAAAEDDAVPNKFKPLAENFWVSPQISVEDIASAKQLGVTLIINNRPDGEEFSQPKGADIEAAAKAAGIAYVAIPVSGANIGPGHLDALDAAMAENDGAVLAFCRSGTRSTLVRAMSKARGGEPIDALVAEAGAAGYNIAGQRPLLSAAAKH
ncbi:MAG: TIGR01244 family sulfur transferase [Parvularculaceae bacterium]|nr:TIGR01244 family phosphatase [Parvularculaceae bacterium]